GGFSREDGPAGNGGNRRCFSKRLFLKTCSTTESVRACRPRISEPALAQPPFSSLAFLNLKRQLFLLLRPGQARVNAVPGSQAMKTPFSILGDFEPIRESGSRHVRIVCDTQPESRRRRVAHCVPA